MDTAEPDTADATGPDRSGDDAGAHDTTDSPAETVDASTGPSRHDAGTDPTAKRPRTALVLGTVAAVVVALVVAAVLWWPSGDGSETTALSFDDAATTAPAADGAPPAPGAPDAATTTPASPAAPDAPAGAAATAASADGAWKFNDRSRVVLRFDGKSAQGDTLPDLKTDRVFGGFTITGTTASDANVIVDIRSTLTNPEMRDNRMRDVLMRAVRLPIVRFTAAKVELGSLPTDGEVTSATVTGDLILAGPPTPVSVKVQCRRVGGELQVLGALPLDLAALAVRSPAATSELPAKATAEFLLVATPG